MIRTGRSAWRCSSAASAVKKGAREPGDDRRFSTGGGDGTGGKEVKQACSRRTVPRAAAPSTSQKTAPAGGASSATIRLEPRQRADDSLGAERVDGRGAMDSVLDAP